MNQHDPFTPDVNTRAEALKRFWDCTPAEQLFTIPGGGRLRLPAIIVGRNQPQDNLVDKIGFIRAGWGRES